MAKYADGTNYAKSIDPSSVNIVDPGVLGGKLRVIQDTFSFAAATVMGSTEYVQVGQILPTNAQVVGIVLSNGGAGTGTDSYLVVGDQGDADRYITQVQSTTAAVTTGPNVKTGINYVVTGTTDNIIRIAGVNSADCINSTGTVKITVFYVVE
jgi:hypothetical protein